VSTFRLCEIRQQPLTRQHRIGPDFAMHIRQIGSSPSTWIRIFDDAHIGPRLFRGGANPFGATNRMTTTARLDPTSTIQSAIFQILI